MFCKYCGHSLDGSRCPHCGKEILLTARSTELETLMAKKAATESGGFVRMPEAARSQEFDVGYRKGFSEGYGTRTAETPPATRPFPVRLAAVLCASLVILSSAVSGILFRNAGFRSGLDRGREEGFRSAEEALDEKYQEGYSRGKADAEKKLDEKYQEGYSRGKSDAEKALQEKYSEGYQQGKADAQKQRPQEDRILFSRKINGGMKDPKIKAVQEILYELGMFRPDASRDLSADGDYGPMTEEAVLRFQQAKGLPETGEIDQATYEMLAEAWSQAKESPAAPETAAPQAEGREEPRNRQFYYLVSR